MNSYNCYDQDGNYHIALPDDATGYLAFQRLLQRLPNLNEPLVEWQGQDPLAELRGKLRKFRPKPSKFNCPRVFISHRQIDKAAALRMAWLANQHRFDYWLDVLDPFLFAAGKCINLTPYQHALLIAAIVELALLNCTHVIALITANSKGSSWIPYEYGRVKDSALTDTHAAAWFDSSCSRLLSVPEYFHLGPKLRTKTEVDAWFDSEFKLFASGRTLKCPTKPWGSMNLTPRFPELE
jgi:hypothetical protein